MKRVFAFLLAVVMVLSLAACSSEKKDYEKAVGLYDSGKYDEAAKAFEKLGGYEDAASYLAKANDGIATEYLKGHWTTEAVDLSKIMMDAMGDELSNSEYGDLSQYFDLSMLSAIFTLDFNEDGTYGLGIDETEYAVVLEKLGESMRQGFLDMVGAMLDAEAQKVGMTMDTMLEELGIDSLEQFVAVAMDVELDDFVAEVVIDPLSEISTAMKSAGTYTVENNIVSMDFGTGVDKATLDMSTGTVTITAESVDQTENSMDAATASLFPMVFTK